VAVRVGAGVEQQPGALDHICGCAGRAAQQQQQRRDAVHRRGGHRRVGGQLGGKGRGIGENEGPLDAVQGGRLHRVYERGPAVEAVLAGDLVLGCAQPDPAVAFAGLGPLAQVLQRRAWW
jgi:hypothetical protein